MNKRELIKLFILIINTIISLVFTITMNDGSIITIFSFVPSLFIYMIYKYDKNKSNIYKISLIVLGIISILLTIFIINVSISHINSFMIGIDGDKLSRSYTTFNPNIIYAFLYNLSLYVILFIGFSDMDKKTYKLNYILTIGVSLLNSIIFIRYLLVLLFKYILKYGELTLDNVIVMNIQEGLYKYYLLFGIMFITIIIHRFIIKKLKLDN